MILTQTLKELGFTKGYKPIGMYTDSEEPAFPDGRGYAMQYGKKLAIEAFISRIPASHVILNAKIETKPGSAHPSYHRILFVLTGDLYLVEGQNLTTSREIILDD